MHTCQVRRGLAHCECHTGFLLASDRRSCEGKVPSPCASPTLGPAVGGPGPSRCCARPWAGDRDTFEERESHFSRSWRAQVGFSVVVVLA